MGIFDGAPDNPGGVIPTSTGGQGETGTGAESNVNSEPATTVNDGQQQVTEPGTVETSPEPGQEGTQTEPKPFDYEKAYKALLPTFTQKSQELAAIKKGQPQQGQDQTLTPAQQNSVMEQISGQMGSWDQQTTDAFWEAMNENPGQTLAFMFQNMMEKAAPELLRPYEQDRQNRELSEQAQTVDKTLKALAVDYPSVKTEEGFGQVIAKAREIAADLGTPDKAANPRILQLAAQELFPQDKERLLNSVKQQGAEEARNNIQAKNGVGTTVNTRTTGKENKSPADVTKENILSFQRRGIFG